MNPSMSVRISFHFRGKEPTVSARYIFMMSRLLKRGIMAVFAFAFFAKITQPEVSLSRR